MWPIFSPIEPFLVLFWPFLAIFGLFSLIINIRKIQENLWKIVAAHHNRVHVLVCHLLTAYPISKSFGVLERADPGLQVWRIWTISIFFALTPPPWGLKSSKWRLFLNFIAKNKKISPERPQYTVYMILP